MNDNLQIELHAECIRFLETTPKQRKIIEEIVKCESQCLDMLHDGTLTTMCAEQSTLFRIMYELSKIYTLTVY